MSKTFAQLNEELVALKAKAEAVRQQEKPGVVKKIREAIQIYELSAQDLFGNSLGTTQAESKQRATSQAADKNTSTQAPQSTAKYRDAHGHAWSGRGPKPGWLKAALDAGRSLDSLRAAPSAESAPANGSLHSVATPAPAVKPKGQKETQKSAAQKSGAQKSVNGKSAFVSIQKYKGDAGQTWSGRGPKPQWVKTALDSGKTLAQLAI